MAALFGPSMVLVFCLSQAFRDVYFADLFQGVDFFAVIVVAFGISTLIFGAVAAIRAPGGLTRMRGHVGTVVAMNLTTALAWTCYFFALKHLEPSIVNTIHSGMAPLTVVVMGAMGLPLAKATKIGPAEGFCYAGIAASLAGLWWVVLSGRSGLVGTFTENLAGLALLLASGSSITVSLLYSKRLHDDGIGSDSVTAVRYLLIVALAAGIEGLGGRPSGIASSGQLLVIAAATTVLIVLPTFALQLGVARTAPLTAQIIRALGPVGIFALEQYDNRLAYSAATLACILAYSAFAIAGNMLHGWRDRPEPAAAPAPRR
jgi:drug/metabolite transporter (DMT)-like permease